MQRTPWFDRPFARLEDNGLLPGIIERLAGTPARVEEIVDGVAEETLRYKPGQNWSIKEQIGHLGDVEPLWMGRVDDLLNHAPALRAADLTNRATHDANHNQTDLSKLTSRFRQLRSEFVSRLRNLSDEQLCHSALHPRLKTPMRVIDLAYFVAEHDDHHLVGIRTIKQSQAAA